MHERYKQEDKEDAERNRKEWKGGGVSFKESRKERERMSTRLTEREIKPPKAGSRNPPPLPAGYRPR